MELGADTLTRFVTGVDQHPHMEAIEVIGLLVCRRLKLRRLQVPRLASKARYCRHAMALALLHRLLATIGRLSLCIAQEGIDPWHRMRPAR